MTLLFLIILTTSILFDRWIIEERKVTWLLPYKSWRKAIGLTPFYVAIALIWCFFLNHKEYRNPISDILLNTFLYASIWTFIKDPLMGVFLHRNWAYLGRGNWDKMWKPMPPAMRVGLKLAVIGYFAFANYNKYIEPITFTIILLIFIALYIDSINLKLKKDEKV